MRYVNAWGTPERRVLTIFSHDVLSIFTKHRQLHRLKSEAGGILLGRRRGQHFEVVYATTPFPTDKRLRTSFIRESAGHEDVVKSMWEDSHGEINYLGEWHTHPEQDPSPSLIDLREWAKLQIQRKNQSNLLTVIVGTKTLYVGLLRGDSTLLKLLEIDEFCTP